MGVILAYPLYLPLITLFDRSSQYACQGYIGGISLLYQYDYLTITY